MFDLISRTNETTYINWHETCKCECRLDASVIILNINRMEINADANAKNWLTKEYLINDLFGILVIANVSVINHVMLQNNSIMKTINAETD